MRDPYTILGVARTAKPQELISIQKISKEVSSRSQCG